MRRVLLKTVKPHNNWGQLIRHFSCKQIHPDTRKAQENSERVCDRYHVIDEDGHNVVNLKLGKGLTYAECSGTISDQKQKIRIVF